MVTTLVAADLLLGLDPTFDPTPTIAWFARTQEDVGWWRALGPEGLADRGDRRLARRATGPFVDRFRWPALLRLDRDRKTQLPRYAWLRPRPQPAELPGLGATTWDIAFFDLADFGDFNRTYGQDAGDDVLGVLRPGAQAASRGPASSATAATSSSSSGTPGDERLDDRSTRSARPGSASSAPTSPRARSGRSRRGSRSTGDRGRS